MVLLAFCQVAAAKTTKPALKVVSTSKHETTSPEMLAVKDVEGFNNLPSQNNTRTMISLFLCRIPTMAIRCIEHLCARARTLQGQVSMFPTIHKNQNKGLASGELTGSWQSEHRVDPKGPHEVIDHRKRSWNMLEPQQMPSQFHLTSKSVLNNYSHSHRADEKAARVTSINNLLHTFIYSDDIA